MKKWVPFVCIALLAALLGGVIAVRATAPKYRKFILRSAKEFALDPGLVASIIHCESHFKKDAVSQKGAIGLMQLMPATAKAFYSGEGPIEEALRVPSENIRLGCALLGYLFEKFEDKVMVLAAYNAGERVALSWRKEGALRLEDIAYPETREYVRRVLKAEKFYHFILS